MKRIVAQDPLADPMIVIKNLRATSIVGNIIPKPSQCQVNKEISQHDAHSVDTYGIDYSTRTFRSQFDKILFDFHGGGYIDSDVHGYTGIECHLSLLFNTSILHMEYRLSPEHSLPVAVYRALLRENISPDQLLIMGDSAGGGLSLLTIQALIAHHLPVPRSVIVLAPWTDLSSSGESSTRNRLTDVMLQIDQIRWMAGQAFGLNPSQLSPDNPIFSPLFCSFQGFPPMYIHVGTVELAEDDSRRAVKKVQDADVDVTFEEGVHLMHVYPVFFSYYPEARNTLDHINKWIQTIFS